LILRAISSVYGAAMAERRRWYARHPARQRRLSKPVISVGNLRMGGSGKTPAVQYIARLLVESGEKPAVLTRGYRRRVASGGVTVVSDGDSVLANLNTAGDEPLLLARTLPGVAVLVGADRYESGLVAERQYGATVHILDDGFQHLALARDVDLLLVAEEDLKEEVLPAGPLRERPASAARADALLVTATYAAAAERVGRSLGVLTTFVVNRTIRAPRLIATDESVIVPTRDPVFAVAGIARPDRFFSDLASAGWRVAGTMVFRDHHPFNQGDVDRIAGRAKAVRAAIILTTEKDAVRLSVCNLADLPMAFVPLVTIIEPEDQFSRWLLDRLRHRRTP
jgi:tetraacyldisaccharide 4'-kinase